METKSSVARLLWSATYLTLVLVVLRFATVSQPFGVRAALPQGQHKVVEEAFSGNPQVRIIKLKVGSDIRRLGEEFEESDDWPRHLSLEIESLAVKPIVYLQVNLNFPETKSSGNLMSYPLRFGLRPGFTDPSTSKPLRLLSGERLDITVDEHYEKLKRFLERRHAIKDLHRAQIEVGFIIFEDGTAWAAGDFLRPDPNDPKRYINVGRSVPN